ncbi:MAG: Asp-tRNA(Asn)/Glu-tRNA(Gln) amidotransferase subunit GatB, partial [bacterium]|nr:Asp-tRNA(Asn)/Glu-tRNA(Gln) amidotransferase subunit GatB [bacterium]
LDAGEKVVQETRGWDDNKKATVSQRIKETSADYRYFPDPDLPPVNIAKFDFAKLEGEIPEMPEQKRIRFKKEYELSEDSIELLVQNKTFADYFEQLISELQEESQLLNVKGKMSVKQLAVNYLTSDLKGLMVEAGIENPSQTKVSAENFADLVVLVANEELGSRGAKDILKIMFENGGDPREIMEKGGMGQISDTAKLTETAQKVISENPDAVEKYKGGNEKLLMFFVGKAMAELGGRANPQLLQEIIKRLLN